MGNTYIRFSTMEELENFLIDFMGFRRMLVNDDGVKRTKKERERTTKSIQEFLEQFKNGTYYKLHNTFYGGIIHKEQDSPIPWSEAGVFRSGIRSLYMQKSYKRRPGYWACIGFRDTKEGREKYDWIEKNIPEDQIGENVPLPEKVRLKDKLKQVQRILDSEVAYRYADQALELLEEVKEKHPELFKGERVYLWEDLARLFDTMDLPEKAVLCFQHQAKLMPDSSDPYLNLGVLYATRGLITQALKSYMKGLEVNPNDEYLYYNFSALLLTEGDANSALRLVNEAILKNPGRGLNFKLKGDILFSKHEYHQAIASYHWALELLDGQWRSTMEECYTSLMECYDRIGEDEEKERVKVEYEDFIKQEQVKKALQCTQGKLYYETGELLYEGSILKDTPYGPGIKYFKNGNIQMEGFFGDWFIEEGREYYENGNLRFEGEYNKGPRHYYGPRYFVKGKLYRESGELWFEGNFRVHHSFTIGFPMQKFPDSFAKGIEYDKEGNVVRVY